MPPCGADSANHVHFANLFMDLAAPRPSARKVSQCVGLDLDHLAAVMRVGGRTLEKVAKLISDDFAAPDARRTRPKAAFRAPVRFTAQQNAGRSRRPTERTRDRPPVCQGPGSRGIAENRSLTRRAAFTAHV